MEVAVTLRGIVIGGLSAAIAFELLIGSVGGDDVSTTPFHPTTPISSFTGCYGDAERSSQGSHNHHDQRTSQESELDGPNSGR
jgi:hypothetical protein